MGAAVMIHSCPFIFELRKEIIVIHLKMSKNQENFSQGLKILGFFY